MEFLDLLGTKQLWANIKQYIAEKLAILTSGNDNEVLTFKDGKAEWGTVNVDNIQIASPTENGLMSSSDKEKVDAIELDNLVTTNTEQEITAIKNFTTKVGINKSDPRTQLDVNGIISTSGETRIGTTGSSYYTAIGSNNSRQYGYIDLRNSSGTVQSNMMFHPGYIESVQYFQAPYFKAGGTTLCPNLNADLLDGVHFSNILEKQYKASANLTKAGWYRIGYTYNNDNHIGHTGFLIVDRSWNNTNNESYTFAISVTRGSGGCITQLSGNANSKLIPYIRLDSKADYKAYIDIYYSETSSIGNNVAVTGIGAIVVQTPTLVTALNGTSYALNTVNGFSLNKAIVPALGISFPTIGTWPTPSTETYPIDSQKITFSGSSDSASLFYRILKSDQGQFVINMGDDDDPQIAFKWNNVDSYIFNKTSVSAAGVSFNVKSIAINGGTSAQLLLANGSTKSTSDYAAASHTHSGYAASSHTHSNLIIKLNGGTTENTNLFTYNGGTAKTCNITASAIGAAASSHTHAYITASYSGSGGQQGPNWCPGGQLKSLMSNATVNSNSEYKNWIYCNPYTGTDVGGCTAIGVSRQSTRAFILSANASATTWARSAELLSTANYTSYCAQASHTHSYLPLSGGTCTGNITAPNFIKGSDRRLKTNIEDLTNRGYLQPKKYIKNGHEELGFIAQDVQEIYPEVVYVNEESPEKYLGLDYDGIIPILAAQILDLKKEIEMLKLQVNELQK